MPPLVPTGPRPSSGPVEILDLGGAVAAAIGPGATIRPGLVDVPPALGKRMGLVLAGDMKGHFDRSAAPNGTPWVPIKPRPQGGSKPLLNTGKLRNSITGQPEPHGASAGTNAIQANLMNAGGTIRPVRAKWLTIPLTREAVRADGARRFPRPLFVIRSRKGNVLLVENPAKTKTGKVKKRKLNESEQTILSKLGDVGGLVPQFLLVRSATIPARPFNGFTDAAIDDCTKMANEYLFGGKGGGKA